MDLEGLVGRAREGDLEAFAEVTRRFQQMAFGYALALLRDLQQAEDVVQESFVAAWFGLRTLADPAAFPGWFRSIVRHQAHGSSDRGTGIRCLLMPRRRARRRAA